MLVRARRMWRQWRSSSSPTSCWRRAGGPATWASDLPGMIPRLVLPIKWRSRHVVGISRAVDGVQRYVWSGTDRRQVVDALRDLHVAGDLVFVDSAAAGIDSADLPGVGGLSGWSVEHHPDREIV